VCPPNPHFVRAAPGETPAGTSFEAVYDLDGVISTVRTPVWTGRVAAATPPAIVGELVVGGRYDVQWATWTGGWAPSEWGPDHSHVSVIACPAPEGGDCWRIDRLDQRWAGWYLFAAESRHAANTVDLAGMIDTPYRVGRDWRPDTGGTRAVSAPAGPVCCVAPPPPAPPVVSQPTTKAPPRVSIRARALRRHGRLIVGRVSCVSRCAVRLTVSGGGRKPIRRVLTAHGAKALTVPVRHGRLRVRVVVDGKLVAAGRTFAR
jgi:hypothetical protein